MIIDHDDCSDNHNNFVKPIGSHCPMSIKVTFEELMWTILSHKSHIWVGYKYTKIKHLSCPSENNMMISWVMMVTMMNFMTWRPWVGMMNYVGMMNLIDMMSLVDMMFTW